MMKNMKNKKWLVRIVSALVLVIMVAMLVAPALADNNTSEGKDYIVHCNNGKKLNLRTGPSTRYKSLRLIPNMADITLYEITKDGKWALVEYDTEIGYVSTKFIVAK